MGEKVEGDPGVARSWEGLTKELYGLRRFGIKPGLERISRALQREGNRQDRFEAIHVAGTNGKGTVASALAALLQSAGHRVGLYTSPHLIDVTERFRIDGVPLAKEAVGPVLRRLLNEYGGQSGAEQGVPKLTFFEITTLAAVILFAEADVDFAVFEVGLGGRLDAVNAIEPVVSVVTTIGRDHTEYLGDTVEEIAAEKAGIFRADVPAIAGVQEWEETEKILAECAERVGAKFELIDGASEDGRNGVADLKRRHWKTAVRAARILLGARLDDACQKQALANWRWPGRQERIGRRGEGDWLFDAAHNPAGVRALSARLSGSPQKLSAICWGSMADKEARGIRKFLATMEVPVWGCVVAGDRARRSEQLRRHVPRDLWRGADSTGRVVRHLDAHVEGDILIFGSLYLLGECYEALGWTAQQLVTYGKEAED